MKAVVIHEAGNSSVLKIEERAIPTPTKDQSVMKIHAFGIHRYEVLTREGGSPSVKFPRVIGIEAVGEIYATDSNSELKVGQKVVTVNGGFGWAFDGSYEEYALVPNGQLYPVQFDGDWIQLASYPEDFFTAYGAIKTTHLAEGQSLLVRGGTTTVGIAAIQLGKAMGYHVTATTRKPESLTKLTEFGADQAILDTDNQLQTETFFDGIIELVGSTTCADSLSHLNKGGVCSIVGMLTGEWIIKELDPFEFLGQRYLTSFDGEGGQEEFDQIFALINQNHLTMPVPRVFKLDQIAAAHDYIMGKHPMGQIVVTTD